jgi:hypothetical protein
MQHQALQVSALGFAPQAAHLRHFHCAFLHATAVAQPENHSSLLVLGCALRPRRGFVAGARGIVLRLRSELVRVQPTALCLVRLAFVR